MRITVARDSQGCRGSEATSTTLRISHVRLHALGARYAGYFSIIGIINDIAYVSNITLSAIPDRNEQEYVMLTYSLHGFPTGYPGHAVARDSRLHERR